MVNVVSYLTELEVEILEREKFEEDLQSMITNQSSDFSRFDDILKHELDRRSVVPQSKKMLLQVCFNLDLFNFLSYSGSFIKWNITKSGESRNVLN